jgi:ABC-type bacteriocin/lantibiotic exporter with double-glycine peptidase domain
MEPEKDTGKIKFPGIKKSLRMNNVSFVYPNTTREVVKNINIEVKK